MVVHAYFTIVFVMSDQASKEKAATNQKKKWRYYLGDGVKDPWTFVFEPSTKFE